VLDEADERVTGETQADRQTGSNGGRYLVMGSKKNDRLVVSFVRSLDRQRSHQLSRAMRAMRRQATTICQRAGINAAFASASPPYRANRPRAKNGNEIAGGGRRNRKKGEKMAARSSNEMKTRRRRARKQKRRSSPETVVETAET